MFFAMSVRLKAQGIVQCLFVPIYFLNRQHDLLIS
uniref:Uncharacterized protein n=1 Tax=Arundo donax TaxID=35708 RepID=A0A0A9FS33_ARUDO